MTEESFQQGRKVMQKANYWRGKITIAKGNVGKWTKIEATYLQNMQPQRAVGAKKMLDKAMKRLTEVREVFSQINFPDSNIVSKKEVNKTEDYECDYCDGCGWYEGGKELMTTCEKCNGTGILHKIKYEPKSLK